ncbi:uncharacterized protein LY89DRAFT_666747 [Mollisia scopiformis]|uniref:Myb-like DNA-binding domain-containing protein n=1 Tax=Mollisia scopiformis TaxID=149040 RepID=A0A194XI54_MOLSC|nr:uncharacterized protein LY89DRAFT_666747 [Mollisia scopiformis]KUJ19905.1 hypothetical protein LY89DRAFT_666747 [Mollisia scopiformis]
MTSLRPAEVTLLVSITKQINSTLDFSEASDKLGITASAAAQRWGRLKAKIVGKGEITLKNGDEHVLITSLAKQFGSTDVNFDMVGKEIGCTKSAATQRWGRLRLKIVGGKDGMKGGPRLRPAGTTKVTKYAPKVKVTPAKKALLEKAVMEEEDVGAKSEASNVVEEENEEDLLAAQLHENRATNANSGYESVAEMEEYVDATTEQDTPMVFNPDAPEEEFVDDDDWIKRAVFADEKYELGIR